MIKSYQLLKGRLLLGYREDEKIYHLLRRINGSGEVRPICNSRTARATTKIRITLANEKGSAPEHLSGYHLCPACRERLLEIGTEELAVCPRGKHHGTLVD